MATKSTRAKLRAQGILAWENLNRAQNNLTGVAAIADGRHPQVEEHLPVIIASLELVMNAVERFNEGL